MPTSLVSSPGIWMGSKSRLQMRLPRHLTLPSASSLRQSILLSAYETAEMRHLYSQSLKNVAGKVLVRKRWPPVQVPEGIEQVR